MDNGCLSRCIVSCHHRDPDGENKKRRRDKTTIHRFESGPRLHKFFRQGKIYGY